MAIVTQKKEKVILRYKPLDWQKIVHEDKHRFKLICAGRRCGKTRSVAADLINRCLSNSYNYNQHNDLAWIAPTFSLTQRGVDAIKIITQDAQQIVKITQTFPTTATFINGVKVKFLSADNPDTLRGYGFTHIVVDEADFIPDYVWQDVLRPALADKQGTMIAITTPKRKASWFHKLYMRGFEEDNIVKSFHFPSSANPHMLKEEIEEARKSMPEDVFRREYLAEYTETGGEVFRNIDSCIVEKHCDCKGARTLIGIDLGKHNDWTVIVAMCLCGHIKKIHRFNQLDWNIQRKMIVEICKEYKSPIISIDARSAGDVIYDNLVEDGLNVEPVKVGNTSKQQLINNLRLKIMNRDITWIESMEWAKEMKHEMECYEVQETRTGLITYNAPSGVGYHDDIVFALALAANNLMAYIHPKTSAEEEIIPTFEELAFQERTPFSFGDNSTHF